MQAVKRIQTFFSTLSQKIREAVLRFPVSIALILVAFALMNYLTWTELFGTPIETTLEKLILTIWIALPLFTSAALFWPKKYLALVPGALLGTLFYWQLQPGEAFNSFFWPMDTLRNFLWGFAFYSTLFILPRWKKWENNGFWQYLHYLFFVLALGLVCAGILGISLNLALFSIERLFLLSVDYRLYETFNLLSGALFLPVFVHIGLPQNWMDLWKLKRYPAFLKAISFYLLTPITGLYFLILAVYLVQILIKWEWPNGHVAMPILYFSALGFGTYLLSYPWRQAWQKIFWVILLPFLAMYFIALGLRIQEYGLTEMRYLGILLGIVLTLLSFYFLFVKRQRLQVSLLCFAVFAFVFSFGPWGVFELSIDSQKARLETLLTEIGALQNGTLQTVSSEEVGEEKQIEISSIVDYLYQRDRLKDFQEWTEVDLSRDTSDESPQIYVPDAFMQAMGLQMSFGGHKLPPDDFFEYSASYTEPLDLKGYETLYRFDLSYSLYDTVSRERSFAELMLGLDASGALSVSYGEESKLEFSLLDLHEQLKNELTSLKYEMDPSLLMLTGETEEFAVKLYFDHFNGTYNENEEELEYLFVTGNLLLRDKD